MTVLNVFDYALSWLVPTYSGMFLTCSNRLRLPTNIMEQPLNGMFLFNGNASRRRSSIWLRILGPMKLISSISMYLIFLSYSWNFSRALPSNGVRSFIGRWRVTWIVDACMLNDATPVGFSSMIVEDLSRQVL